MLIQHLHYTLGACPAHGYHYKHHGKHHKAHKYLHGIGHKAHKLARRHNGGAAAHYKLCAEVAYKQHAGVYGKLHKGHIEGQNFFRLHKIGVYLAGYLLEFFILKILADIGFYHPYAAQVLLHHAVELIVLFEAAGKHRVHAGHYKVKPHAQYGQRRHKHKGKLNIYPEGHHHCKYQHHRAAHRNAGYHLKRVLHIGNIGGQPCYKAGGGVFINV